MRFDKRSCLDRAKRLLEAGDDSTLRYACLELRFCMEAVTYQKLETYGKRLPKSIYSKWQPPQAVKALLVLEPEADQDFHLQVAFESTPGRPTGKWLNWGSHKSLRLGWLRKHYNKLGNLLHIPPPGTNTSVLQRDPTGLREYLQGVVSELEPVVASRIDSSLAVLVNFRCSVCKEPVVANLEGVRKSHKAACLNPSCEAEFSALEGEDGNIKFELLATDFDCRKCGHKNFLENRHLQVGLNFRCSKCHADHMLVRRGWSYGLMSDLEAANMAPDTTVEG